MYCQPCLSKGEGSFEVAVLDTIHGAGAIAERMVAMGIDARALEVYHSSHDLESCNLIVAPVHLWPGNPTLKEARRLGKSVVTHHRAVGELLAADRDFRAFEITGTRGKTTTALLLSRVLSRRHKTVSHTTRGIEVWEGGRSRLIRRGLSITPANVILAFDAAAASKAEALVSEVSLGGTGAADYGVITSFSKDYMVAGNTLWASTAKLQLVSLARPGSRLISNVDAKISSDITFGPGGDAGCGEAGITCRGRSVPLELGEGFDPSSYLPAISAATAAGVVAGMDLAEVSSALEGFEGLGGRMKRTQLGETTVYDNSNSGLNVSGVGLAMDYAAGHGRLGVVVGEEAETVCEGMDIPGLVDLIRTRREEMDYLVLVGERLQPYAGELGAATAEDLASGFELARFFCPERLLLCVKCFR